MKETPVKDILLNEDNTLDIFTLTNINQAGNEIGLHSQINKWIGLCVILTGYT